MRLFQLIDPADDANIGLYCITRDCITDEDAEQMIKDNYGNDDYLEEFGIERVFVTNIIL